MNSIHSRYRNEAGHVVSYPQPGEIFDVEKCLILDQRAVYLTVTGEVIARTADYGGVTIGLLTDSITRYNRMFHPDLMDDSSYNEEFAMLHGGDY